MKNRRHLPTGRCEELLYSLAGIGKSCKLRYCIVGQERLRERLYTCHGYEISKRTLNRDLRVLEDDGYIERVKRHKRGENGEMVFRCTLYKLTAKFFNWLYSVGERVKRLFKWFRLPKWAQYQLLQKHASSIGSASSGKMVVFMGKDGRPMKYFPGKGDPVPA